MDTHNCLWFGVIIFINSVYKIEIMKGQTFSLPLSVREQIKGSEHKEIRQMASKLCGWLKQLPIKKDITAGYILEFDLYLYTQVADDPFTYEWDFKITPLSLICDKDNNPIDSLTDVRRYFGIEDRKKLAREWQHPKVDNTYSKPANITYDKLGRKHSI